MIEENINVYEKFNLDILFKEKEINKLLKHIEFIILKIKKNSLKINL